MPPGGRREQESARGEIAYWLPATKLRAPARRHDALLRPRLLDHFKTSLETARLTLVSAPAGAGKTSLLAELPHAFPNLRWAWLLLDAEDSDPSRFAAAMAAALEQIDPALGESAGAAPQGTSAGRQAVTAIINNVVQSTGDPIVLVIDDYHVIAEEGVHQTVEYLIDRLPPNLRVVIGTRHDPPIALARWRARGELAEIRVAELSFTEDETAGLIAGLKLSIDPQSVQLLHSRTEGWAAGLRLLATSFAQSPSSSRALLDHGMQGRLRIFEFLSEEVFDRQEPRLQEFLLQTSVLFSLNAAACDSLTGRDDSQLVLDKLYRQNLYVAAVDESGSNYRYHDLFADFLRDRLRRTRPQEWASMHERAGRLECDSGRRIRHWAIAGNWDEAAAEIVRIGPDYMHRGFAVTLSRWIQEMPEAVRLRHPRLSLLHGTAIWMTSQLGEAQGQFEQALAGFRQAGDEAGQGESLVALSITAIMFGEPERAHELFEQAVQFPLPAASRLELHAAAGWDALNRRDWPAMHRHLDELLDLLAEPTVATNPFALMLLLYGTSFPEFVDRLDQALHRFRANLESASEFSKGYSYAMRAWCQQFRGDIAGSRQTAETALQLTHAAEFPLIVRLFLTVTLQLAAFAEGDWPRVETLAADLARDHEMTPFLRVWRPQGECFRGRARWLGGDTAGLEECYRGIETPEPEETPHADVFRLVLRGILRLNERAWAQAQEALEKAWRVQQEHAMSAGFANAAVLLAHLHLKRGHTEEAAEVFFPLLAMLERLNGPGFLLRENPIVIPLLRLAHARGRHRAFAERCLELLGAPLHAEEETGGEALSERETEVLRVMAEGLGNRAIGERLFVSEATVKTHVQRILRKLEASSRTQAVARAREMMLL